MYVHSVPPKQDNETCLVLMSLVETTWQDVFLYTIYVQDQ